MYDPDVGRLVIQCACSRAARWHGPEVAKLQGWLGRWIRTPAGVLRRRWVCPECIVAAPRAKPRQSTFVVPLPDLGMALSQPARALARVDEVLLVDPEAVGDFFEELFRRRSLLKAARLLELWERWSRDRGFEPPPPGPRKKKRKRGLEA